MIKYLNDENFKEEIQKEKLLVDFYADWCGPCKAIASVLESLENIDILKVNVDLHEDIAREYGIMSIPTLILFQRGEEKGKKIGFLSKEEIEKWLKEN